MLRETDLHRNLRSGIA